MRSALLALIFVACGSPLIEAEAPQLVGTAYEAVSPDGGCLPLNGRFQGGRTITAVSSSPKCDGMGLVGQVAGDDLPLRPAPYCSGGSCHVVEQNGCAVTIRHTYSPTSLGTYELVRTGTIVNLADGGTRIEGSAVATGTGEFCPSQTYGAAYLEQVGP